MAKIIGYNESKYKKLTCSNCLAIVQYCNADIYDSGRTDEGTKIMGFYCPGCGHWLRTNP